VNIAFTTLFLFFLLIPGILFRKLYYSEEFSKEFFKESLFGVFTATFLPSLVFQTIWIYLVQLFGFEVDLAIIGNLISADTSYLFFDSLVNNFNLILVYNLSLFTFSGLAGLLSKQTVRRLRWDRKFKFFRFQNTWHYILKGEFFDFPHADISLQKDTVEDIEFVFVDAIIDLQGDSYLYNGILVDYELSNEGGLKNISITESIRRKISDEAAINNDEPNKFYNIKGHLLLIKYEIIKNINFTYYTVDYDSENQNFIPREVE
jgi:hypothetical protein